MDIQNFRAMQNFKYKEHKLNQTLKKQKSLLQSLRQKYENLKSQPKVGTSTEEKLEQKKKLRSIYTFRLSPTKQKNVNEVPARYHHGWLQRSLTNLPDRTQNLYMKRNQMIQLGNSYSRNNQKDPFVRRTMIRATSAKAPNEMKYEIWSRARNLGNRYSFLFRKQHQSIVYNKNFNLYQKLENLINQKNDMEKIMKHVIDVPQTFTQRYFSVLDEINRLGKILNIKKQKQQPPQSRNKITHKNPHLHECLSEKLLAELKRTSLDRTDVAVNGIEMNKAMEKVRIEEILEAMNAVDQDMIEIFKNSQKFAGKIKDFKDVNVQEDDSIPNEGLDDSFSEYFDARQSQHNVLSSKAFDSLKEYENLFKKRYSDQLKPKHHNSLVDLTINEPFYPEIKYSFSEHQETDDCKKYSRVSHSDVCKSHSKRTDSASSSSNLTSTAVKQDDLNAQDGLINKITINESNEYSSQQPSWNNEDSMTIKQDVNDERKFFNKLLLHV